VETVAFMLELAVLVALDVALADALEATMAVAFDFKLTLGGDLVVGFLMLRILEALSPLVELT